MMEFLVKYLATARHNTNFMQRQFNSIEEISEYPIFQYVSTQAI